MPTTPTKTSRTGTTRHKKWAAQLKRQARANGQTHCPRCNIWLDYQRGKRPNSAEADHITPHAQGGTTTLDNGQILCRRCNQQLGAKLANKNKKHNTNQPPKPPIKTINFRPNN